MVISVLGGFVIGHPFELPFPLLKALATLLGVLLLSAGSSALNQVQEADLDARMPRTSQRPIPSGKLSIPQALGVSLLLILLGGAVLMVTDLQVAALGAVAVLLYNGLYTLWWKPNWAFAAIPGAIPGALPVLMGYVSASGRLIDLPGAYLFLILFYWQMPHFWSLALRFREDYSLGGIPTLPVAHGIHATLKHIGIWSAGYAALLLLAPFVLGVGALYLGIIGLFIFKVMVELLRFVRNPDSKQWLRFFLWVNFSLVAFLFAASLDLWWIYVQLYFV